jgi:hypothetical protein
MRRRRHTPSASIAAAKARVEPIANEPQRCVQAELVRIPVLRGGLVEVYLGREPLPPRLRLLGRELAGRVAEEREHGAGFRRQERSEALIRPFPRVEPKASLRRRAVRARRAATRSSP